MRYRDLAGLKPTPSQLVLGTGVFGSQLPEPEAFALLDAFAAGGGNFLDTAHVYAAWLPNGAGASERTIGKWLKRTGARERIVVGTKGAHIDMKTGASRMRADCLAKDLEESLGRLQSPYIDLYWLHRDDPAVPVGEILGWLNEHLRAGKLRALGCSNWAPARIEEANRYAASNGLTGFCASQIGWALAWPQPAFDPKSLTRYVDAETEAFHRRTGFTQVAYSSQANGFFSGRYGPGLPPEAQKPGVLRKYGSPRNYKRLAAATELAGRRGVSANQVALTGLLEQPFPFFAIVGPKNIEQLRDSLAAADLRLSADELAGLECNG